MLNVAKDYFHNVKYEFDGETNYSLIADISEEFHEGKEQRAFNFEKLDNDNDKGQNDMDLANAVNLDELSEESEETKFKKEQEK